jgi:hypothetical protein
MKPKRTVVKKSEIDSRNFTLFHFLTLFFDEQVKRGKETVKFLVIFDHLNLQPLPPLKLPVLTLLS